MFAFYVMFPYDFYCTKNDSGIIYSVLAMSRKLKPHPLYGIMCVWVCVCARVCVRACVHACCIRKYNEIL